MNWSTNKGRGKKSQQFIKNYSSYAGNVLTDLKNASSLLSFNDQVNVLVGAIRIYLCNDQKKRKKEKKEGTGVP